MPYPVKGERRGGRQKGTPNKATAEIKDVARKHGPAAIKELARIMLEGDSDNAKIAAIKELLDRGYGKARQPITGEDEGSPVEQVIQIVTGVPREQSPD